MMSSFATLRKLSDRENFSLGHCTWFLPLSVFGRGKNVVIESNESNIDARPNGPAGTWKANSMAPLSILINA